MPAIIASIERRVRARHRSVNTQIEIHQRIAEIERDGAELYKQYDNWKPVSDRSYEYFTYFESSGYNPSIYRDGGLSNQPRWLLNDFKGYFAITEYKELVHEKGRLEQRLSEINSKPL